VANEIDVTTIHGTLYGSQQAGWDPKAEANRGGMMHTPVKEP